MLHPIQNQTIQLWEREVSGSGSQGFPGNLTAGAGTMRWHSLPTATGEEKTRDTQAFQLEYAQMLS